MVDEPNPWSAENWNLTAQSKYFLLHGEAKARARAHDAGVEFGVPPPAAASQRKFLDAEYVVHEIHTSAT